jgi:hypothetical protein
MPISTLVREPTVLGERSKRDDLLHPKRRDPVTSEDLAESLRVAGHGAESVDLRRVNLLLQTRTVQALVDRHDEWSLPGDALYARMNNVLAHEPEPSLLNPHPGCGPSGLILV